MYWYKSQLSRESKNHIAIAEMKKVQGVKSGKFMIVCGDKVYKFLCKSEEDKDAWVNALTLEIKRVRGESFKKIENVYELKLKKKVIIDYYHLPNIYSEKLYMKKRVDECIKSENFFQLKIRKK